MCIRDRYQRRVHGATSTSFSSLVKLDLARTKVTDSSLLALTESKSLTKLTHLDLSDCADITNKGFIPIAQSTILHNIRQLNISHTKSGNKALSAIASFTSLTILSLSGTGITDAGLLNLVSSLSLRLEQNPLVHLDVGETDITDESLVVLATVPTLKVLELSDCKHISDIGVKKIASSTQMNSLLKLGLTRTKVTDECIKVFCQPHSCPNLLYLNLWRCELVTRAGVEMLKARGVMVCKDQSILVCFR
eukprot:TRINITY_DN4823_c0_g1_i1.p1 TRINITY_DN4823_c0_g1~~TRINITY_DN4823_c0_g1_i1.p1  ORF type:complete len:268 (-),score=29.24 TRINITY_DN4823_c0_g1_i1:181-927(-)